MKTFPLLCATILLAPLVSTAQGAVQTYQYRYDDLGRLNGVSTADTAVVTYAYDPVGNITAINPADWDGDGLADADETAIYHTDPWTPDTDGDTMPDGWEVTNRLDPTVSDATSDADSDGFQNGEEFAAGTDPNSIPIVYVNSGAAGVADGRSWPTAFTTLQDGLQYARLKAELWVAAGTYRPDQGGGKILGDRSASFVLKNGIAIYGGFAGTETALSQRNSDLNLTLLSGELTDPASIADNSYHVATSTNNDATAILDGVAIAGGNAESGQGYPGSYGGGLLIDGGSPVITDTFLAYNKAEFGGGLAVVNASPALTAVLCVDNDATYGGGLLNYGGTLSATGLTLAGNSANNGGGMANLLGALTIDDGVISQNSAFAGGGVFADSGALTIDHSSIYGNTADYGAGLWGSAGSLVATNTILAGNEASVIGGAMFLADGERATFLNDDVLNNSAGSFGGILYVNNQSELAVTNSILWGNYDPYNALMVLESGSTVRIRYSDMEGGAGAIVNLDTTGGTVTYENNIEPPANPLLDESFHLLLDSPCIDAGDPVTPPPAEDIDGESRPNPTGAGVDMGVDEYYAY